MAHSAYKNANGNSKFNKTKLNPWKMSVILCCLKLNVIKIKFSVILANNYKVKAKNFIIPISFYGT